jgi:hypothetical protein
MGKQAWARVWRYGIGSLLATVLLSGCVLREGQQWMQIQFGPYFHQVVYGRIATTEIVWVWKHVCKRSRSCFADQISNPAVWHGDGGYWLLKDAAQRRIESLFTALDRHTVDGCLGNDLLTVVYPGGWGMAPSSSSLCFTGRTTTE